MKLLTPDQCARAELLSRSHGTRAVSRLTGIARSTLTLLRKRSWTPIVAHAGVRPCPTDFAIQCRHMKRRELARHYRTSNRVITRWKREAGL